MDSADDVGIQGDERRIVRTPLVEQTSAILDSPGTQFQPFQYRTSGFSRIGSRRESRVLSGRSSSQTLESASYLPSSSHQLPTLQAAAPEKDDDIIVSGNRVSSSRGAFSPAFDSASMTFPGSFHPGQGQTDRSERTDENILELQQQISDKDKQIAALQAQLNAVQVATEKDIAHLQMLLSLRDSSIAQSAERAEKAEEEKTKVLVDIDKQITEIQSFLSKTEEENKQFYEQLMEERETIVKLTKEKNSLWNDVRALEKERDEALAREKQLRMTLSSMERQLEDARFQMENHTTQATCQKVFAKQSDSSTRYIDDPSGSEASHEKDATQGEKKWEKKEEIGSFSPDRRQISEDAEVSELKEALIRAQHDLKRLEGEKERAEETARKLQTELSTLKEMASQEASEKEAIEKDNQRLRAESENLAALRMSQALLSRSQPHPQQLDVEARPVSVQLKDEAKSSSSSSVSSSLPSEATIAQNASSDHPISREPAPDAELLRQENEDIHREASAIIVSLQEELSSAKASEAVLQSMLQKERENTAQLRISYEQELKGRMDERKALVTAAQAIADSKDELDRLSRRVEKMTGELQKDDSTRGWKGIFLVEMKHAKELLATLLHSTRQLQTLFARSFEAERMDMGATLPSSPAAADAKRESMGPFPDKEELDRVAETCQRCLFDISRIHDTLLDLPPSSSSLSSSSSSLLSTLPRGLTSSATPSFLSSTLASSPEFQSLIKEYCAELSQFVASQKEAFDRLFSDLQTRNTFLFEESRTLKAEKAELLRFKSRVVPILTRVHDTLQMLPSPTSSAPFSPLSSLSSSRFSPLLTLTQSGPASDDLDELISNIKSSLQQFEMGSTFSLSRSISQTPESAQRQPPTLLSTKPPQTGVSFLPPSDRSSTQLITTPQKIPSPLKQTFTQPQYRTPLHSDHQPSSTFRPTPTTSSTSPNHFPAHISPSRPSTTSSSSTPSTISAPSVTPFHHHSTLSSDFTHSAISHPTLPLQTPLVSLSRTSHFSQTLNPK